MCVSSNASMTAGKKRRRKIEEGEKIFIPKGAGEFPS